MISFSCQKCGAAFRLKDDKAGKKCKCPKCDAAIVIPMLMPPREGLQEVNSVSQHDFAGKTPPEKPVESAPISTASPCNSGLPRLLWFGQAEE
jgi:DNA-directed RNA polymerase subunit RPC12/RpoP